MKKLLDESGCFCALRGGYISSFPYTKTLENEMTIICYSFTDDLDFRLSFLQVYRLFPNTKAGQDGVYDR